MDKVIDSQFSRVEKALSTLINSIATYNPNPSLAADLVAADEELSQGLKLCVSPQQLLNLLRPPASASPTAFRDEEFELTWSSVYAPSQLCADHIAAQHIQSPR
jgi:hypothetical protein